MNGKSSPSRRAVRAATLRRRASLRPGRTIRCPAFASARRDFKFVEQASDLTLTDSQGRRFRVRCGVNAAIRTSVIVLIDARISGIAVGQLGSRTGRCHLHESMSHS